MTAKRQPTPDKHPEHFLRALGNSHEHMRGVYRHDGCYELFRVLRTVWPEAQSPLRPVSSVVLREYHDLKRRQ